MLMVREGIGDGLPSNFRARSSANRRMTRLDLWTVLDVCVRRDSVLHAGWTFMF